MAQEEQYLGGHESCRGLSDLGRRQVEALRDRLLQTEELDGVAAAYCSILPRAIETAEILKPAIGDLEVEQDCDLCEGHPGEADGLKWDEWRARYGDDFYGRGPYVAFAPGAESWADLVVRTGRALTHLAAKHKGETVAVICHGGIINASLHVFGHLPLDIQWRSQIDNASLNEWSLHDHPDKHPGGRWTLMRLNDASHLRGFVTN